MAFVGIGRGDPLHTLTLRPVPIFGMRWNHRLVALTFASIFFVEWILRVSGADCPPLGITYFQYIIAFALIGPALFVLGNLAHAAPNVVLGLLRLLQARYGIRYPRLDRLFNTLRRWLRGFWVAFGVVMVWYAFMVALAWGGAALSGLAINLTAVLLLVLLSFLSACVPPLLIFWCYKPERFHLEADEENIFGQPGRSDLEELSIALHGLVRSEWAYRRELLKQILVPTRTMHAAITGTRNLDRVQSGLTSFLLKRQLVNDQIMQVLLIGYPIFGGWLVLISAAVLRSVSSAALAFGALVLGALTAIFLAILQKKLVEMLTLNSAERESFPVWAARSLALDSELPAPTPEKYEGSLFPATWVFDRGEMPLLLVTRIGGAVYGILFVGFLAVLSSSQLKPRIDGPGIGASVLRCAPAPTVPTPIRFHSTS